MRSTQERLPDLHYDFISHVAARFGISEEIVSARLGEWLLDVKHDNQRWQQQLAARA